MDSSHVFDYRTLCRPGQSPPGLTCDICQQKIPYGEAEIYSATVEDFDACAPCADSKLTAFEKEKLTKTTVMARVAPMVDPMFESIKAEKLVEQAVAQIPAMEAAMLREGTTRVEVVGAQGFGHIELLPGAPPEMLAMMMAHYGVERVD